VAVVAVLDVRHHRDGLDAEEDVAALRARIELTRAGHDRRHERGLAGILPAGDLDFGVLGLGSDLVGLLADLALDRALREQELGLAVLEWRSGTTSIVRGLVDRSTGRSAAARPAPALPASKAQSTASGRFGQNSLRTRATISVPFLESRSVGLGVPWPPPGDGGQIQS
jgi:hypothetical protein